MKKSEKWDEIHARGLQVGDPVVVQEKGKVLHGRIDAIAASGTKYFVKAAGLSTCVSADFKNTEYDPAYVGEDPFEEQDYWAQISFSNITMMGLLLLAGYDFESKQVKATTADSGGTYGGINFDPEVTDRTGAKVKYQRPLVWDLHDKQLLIDSIYRGLEIGKFVIRLHEWKSMDVIMKSGKHAYDSDCVDGKQRFNALIDFVTNKYQDSHGNFYDDLSIRAQRRFMGFSKFAFGTMGERATDADVLKTFLMVNFTGVQMSEDHIKFVADLHKKI
jgi:hypothetical protein